MIAIAIEFLAGRYHGTPWDRHANEGAVEWPPSPWRILRALVAASYRVEPRPAPDEFAQLIGKLTAPPIYRAPRCSEGHTRHYMPTDDKPTLVFDAFVAVGGGAGAGDELVIGWPDVELDPSEIKLLDELLAVTGYLGRAESWVVARRIDWRGQDANVRPVSVAGRATVRGTIRLQSVLRPQEYEEWVGMAPRPKGKKPHLPKDILEVLQQTTEELHRQGWSQAPGSTWVTYERPDSLIEVQPKRRIAARGEAMPTFARYAVSSAVLPRLTEAIAIGERVRIALMSHAGKRNASTLATFSGKDADGRPLIGHGHAYYLPADDDGDGRIDHLVVYARGGFTEDSRHVLESLNRVWGHGGHDIYLSLIGLGTPADYAGSGHDGRTALAGTASLWESRTPVVMPRHMKRRRVGWVDTPEEQVTRMLEQLGHPQPISVERIAGTRVKDSVLPWFRFRRARLSGGGRRAGVTGFGFRIRFAQPVNGPITIGYASHLGLGQFVAIE